MKQTGKSADKSEFFHKNGLSMAYAKWGAGSKVLLTFHGFGRGHQDFYDFTRDLQARYTIYSCTIFFHGDSTIGSRSADKQPMSTKEFAEFFSEFILFTSASQVWLMGYSLGGRMALKMAEVLPEKVAGLYLFAPDGLIVNRWYAAFSKYALGRGAFRYFIKNNAAMFKTVDAIIRFGLISPKLGEFVRWRVHSAQMQNQVYNTWTFLRYIEPNITQLAEVLHSNQISVNVFFGRYDQIIPQKNVLRLKKKYPKTKVCVLESGHALLTERNMKIILREGWI